MPTLQKEITTKGNDSVRVITDLNCSDTYKVDGKKYINKNGRVYSVKTRDIKNKWKLNGHSNRLILENVTSTTQEGARQTVLKTNAKAPHSFLDGVLISHTVNEEEHKALIAEMLAQGAQYLSYDPYKVKGFVLLNEAHLPKDCSKLEAFKGAKKVYCFEDSVLALV